MSSGVKYYIFRGVAIFFLLFTLADLANPHFCSEEMEGLPLPTKGEARMNTDSDRKVAPAATDDSQHREESPEPGSDNEDCFCCCSHIIPAIHFTVSGADLKTPSTDLFNSSLPTSPPQSRYHPPRLS